MPEIESIFVQATAFGSSTTRQPIWSDYLRAHATLDQAIPVLAAWIGGSFTTGKVDPDDLDVLWIVDGRRYPSLTPVQLQVVSAFARGRYLRQRTGARVDTYILPWEPIPVPDVANAQHRQLAAIRGYWDDLWLRMIEGPKAAPRTANDTIPRRGYLEVTYRDYLHP